MSGSEEDTYSMIFTSLKHPIRRGILRILSDNPQSFSDMQRLLKIESSHLTYHLEGLGNLLVKTEEGKYALSSLGEAAVSTMMRVEEPPKAHPSLRLPFDHPRLSFLSSNKSRSKIISIIGIALLASSFLFFYLSSISDYDHATTYNHVVNLDTRPFLDPITNISWQTIGYTWMGVLLQPHDYLTVSLENLPANGTAYIKFHGFQQGKGEGPTNLTWTDYFSLERSSTNGFLDFRNTLPTEIWGDLSVMSLISQTYFITMTLHHYETLKWLFFCVGLVFASLGVVTIFKSKR